MKLKQNTETTLKLFQSCFRLISIFTDMSKNMQIVKLFQAFQPIRARQLLGQCMVLASGHAGDACSAWSVARLACVLNHSIYRKTMTLNVYYLLRVPSKFDYIILI